MKEIPHNIKLGVDIEGNTYTGGLQVGDSLNDEYEVTHTIYCGFYKMKDSERIVAPSLRAMIQTIERIGCKYHTSPVYASDGKNSGIAIYGLKKLTPN